MTIPSRGVAAVLAACSLLGLQACSGGSSPSSAEAANAPKKREAVRVRTAPVERREMVRTISTTTVVESENEIKLFPRAAGVVTEVRAEEGDHVEAGAVLAVLDRRSTLSAVEEARIALRESEDAVLRADVMKAEAEARVAQARIKEAQAARDYVRNEKANLVSEQALDNLRMQRDTAASDRVALELGVERAALDAQASRTTRDKAKHALERMELDDSYMQIVAPFAGVVATRSIRVGDAVSTAAPAFVLTDASRLRAVVFRPQRELALFTAAARASDAAPSAAALEIRATAEALPGRTFAGQLLLVSPSIDAQSGSFRVTVRFPSDEIDGARLLPGMLVRIEIVTDRRKDALVVPKRALRREGEENLVFLVREGAARRVRVAEGFSDDERVEILPLDGGTIAVNERVIVVGNRELEEGADVVEDATGAPASAPPVPQADAAATAAKQG